jgi:branched-chain amino acid aminotransferase
LRFMRTGRRVMLNGRSLKITGWIGVRMSPCLIRFLTQDGLQPADYQADSLTDAAHHEPKDGVYTVTNTYNVYQTLKLDAHLDRLEESARRAGMELTLDRAYLRLTLRQMIDEFGEGDVRFRVTAPHDPGHLIISMEPYAPPVSDVYQKGVRCVTVPNGARSNPIVKSTGWMYIREELRSNLGLDVYEAILLSGNGDMLEGTSSNFYAIMNGSLHTANEGVLAGISRQVVFDVAPAIVPLRYTPVNVHDVPNLSEAFITSSSRGIVPVVKIDDLSVGSGIPGRITKALQRDYTIWVQNHLEAL